MLNLTIFVVQAAAVGILVLALFSLRSRLGLAPLFCAVGVFQYVQVVLSTSAYIEVLPGVVVSPGSAILFPSTLLAVLLVYIRDDATAARQLTYGVLAANLTAALVLALVGFQLSGQLADGPVTLPAEFHLASARILVSGTLFLWLDVILVILMFETLARVPRLPLLVRAFVTLSVVLALDSFLFVRFNFAGVADADAILSSSVMSRTIVSALYALSLTVYLRATHASELAGAHVGTPIRDVFEILTYRQKFEALRHSAVRDALTGAYNRRFLDDFLPQEVERAHRLEQELAVLMVDVDHFKRINDEHGHAEGDRVLAILAGVLKSTVRDADAVVRYGGEEFAVVVPGTSLASAGELAARIRANLAAMCGEARPPLGGGQVHVTIGVAVFPGEASTAAELLERADQRLLRGKRAGRDRVVVTDTPAGEAVAKVVTTAS